MREGGSLSAMFYALRAEDNFVSSGLPPSLGFQGFNLGK